MIRIFDIILAFLGLVVTFPLLIIISIISYWDTGSPFLFQERVGKNKNPFILIKFRTMNIDTKFIASHLVDPSSVTYFGRFLRKTKIDELPQLWNVLKGEMSLVGPRPGLPNQEELIFARDKYSVFNIKPGITGLSQINGIDMSDPDKLAKSDAKMIKSISVKNYLKYIIMTLIGKGQGDRVLKK